MTSFAAIIAAAIHDVDHPGLNNNYLKKTSSKLAILYNDNSVLENHHTAIGFSIMMLDGCDAIPIAFEREKQSQKWLTFRRIVIDLVLATDMSKHMKLLADMKTMVESKSLKLSVNHTDRVQVLQTLIHCADLSNTSKSLDTYKFWLNSIQEEFFNQGDLEKKLNLEISPMCNRITDSTMIAQNQIGFIDYIEPQILMSPAVSCGIGKKAGDAT